MPTDFAFRFSTYLTLALACACLGYAEWEYLPEVTAFTGAVVVALVAAFRAEWRFSLSLTAANWVGAGIFLAAVFWISIHWRNDQSLLHTLPWPAGLLPYLGPIVMTAIVAKLFRPKHVGDWWTMHGMGLAAVGLGRITDRGRSVRRPAPGLRRGRGVEPDPILPAACGRADPTGPAGRHDRWNARGRGLVPVVRRRRRDRPGRRRPAPGPAPPSRRAFRPLPRPQGPRLARPGWSVRLSTFLCHAAIRRHALAAPADPHGDRLLGRVGGGPQTDGRTGGQPGDGLRGNGHGPRRKPPRRSAPGPPVARPGVRRLRRRQVDADHRQGRWPPGATGPPGR